MERAAVLRVKRKRGGPEPVGALLVAKKPRPDPESEDPPPNSLFRLVATLASQDEPVHKYVQEAISKDRAAQSLRPSLRSTQRVIQGLRTSQQASREESRYRLISRHRPHLTDGENIPDGESKEKGQLASRAEKDTSQKGSQETDDCEEFQLLDIIREDTEKDSVMPAAFLQESDDPDVILCNAVEMIRQRLSVTDSNREAEHSPKKGEYVYDIYYMEAAAPGWIENILTVQPYTQDCELVCEDCIPEETYEDEDDENNENNWRNDYPDEEFLPEEENESENSFSDEDSGYIRRTWDKYQTDVLREFDYDGFQELDSE